MSESGSRTVVSVPAHRRRRARGLGLVLAIGLAAAACGEPSLPPVAPAETVAAFEACRGLAWEDKQACYEARLLDELAESGTVAALDMLGWLAAADRDVQSQSHVLTHAIGISAYAPGETFTDVFEECTEVFQSGCYHGVVQAYFIATGEPDAEKVAGLCAPYEADPSDRWLLFQCLHGLGHGLTMYYGHHLLMALDGCDLLTTGWNRNSCYGGAFMENVVNAVAPHHPAAALVSADTASENGAGEGAEASAHGAGAHDHGVMAMAEGIEAFEPLRSDDPHYPCSILDEKYLTSCYQMQTSAMLWHNDGDIADAASTCLDAPDGWRDDCFMSLGRDISGRTLQDEDDARRECRKSPEDYRVWCYVGVVRNFVDVTATTDAGFSFCRALEDSAKPRCHEAMGEALYSLYADEAARREACGASETEELALECRRGALVTD
ncbi:MAG: hypothetical protein F4X22_01810 [Gemmatimonadales bacterium]|nr:hypothetical protein [Candidatus Palauibacter denitrificans]